MTHAESPARDRPGPGVKSDADFNGATSQMSTSTRTWTLLFKIPGGHKYFEGPDGRVGVADDSGRTPDATDGARIGEGALRVERGKPIRFGNFAAIPVVDEAGEEHCVLESAEGGLMVAARLGMSVNAGGHDYRLAPASE